MLSIKIEDSGPFDPNIIGQINSSHWVELHMSNGIEYIRKIRNFEGRKQYLFLDQWSDIPIGTTIFWEESNERSDDSPVQ